MGYNLLVCSSMWPAAPRPLSVLDTPDKHCPHVDKNTLSDAGVGCHAQKEPEPDPQPSCSSLTEELNRSSIKGESGVRKPCSAEAQ